MSENLVNTCNALDALANSVRDSWTDDRTLQEAYGWHLPAVTRHDIADQVRKLADRMREVCQFFYAAPVNQFCKPLGNHNGPATPSSPRHCETQSAPAFDRAS